MNSWHRRGDIAGNIDRALVKELLLCWLAWVANEENASTRRLEMAVQCSSIVKPEKSNPFRRASSICCVMASLRSLLIFLRMSASGALGLASAATRIVSSMSLINEGARLCLL